MTQGESVTVGSTRLVVFWPSAAQIAMMAPQPSGSVLGARSAVNVNDASVVLWLRYGSFDALLTGDADSRVEFGYLGTTLADDQVEVLKVPHHGSKTGITEAFLDWLKPQLAVISVGKNNTYGHPAEEILEILRYRDVRILRTDQEGDIEVVSDGNGWLVTNHQAH